MDKSKVLRSSTATTINAAGTTGAAAIKRGQIVACQLCNKKFGTFMKEHQCKRCCRAVCDECSKSKAKIIGYEVKPNVSHRICKFCKEESDFQSELRVKISLNLNECFNIKKNSLLISANSEIGLKWCTNLELINAQTKNLDLSNMRQAYEAQSAAQLDNPFSLTVFKKELNYSQMEFFHYIGLKESEEKIDLIVNVLLQKLLARMQWERIPVKLDQLVYYLLAFCSDYVVYHIVVYIYEHILPDYAKEFLTNVDDSNIESEIWNATRLILIQSCRDIFNFNEGETKAVNAFILNEGREMISTLMIRDISLQCFHHLFEEMMSVIKFEEWEKSFLSLIKFNLNVIKDPKTETHLAILRNTKIMELKKIKKDFEGQFKGIQLKINEKRTMSQNVDQNEMERLKDEFQRAKEQLEKKEKEIDVLKSTILETPKSQQTIGIDGGFSMEINDENSSKTKSIDNAEIDQLKKEFENEKSQLESTLMASKEREEFLQAQIEEVKKDHEAQLREYQTQIEAYQKKTQQEQDNDKGYLIQLEEANAREKELTSQLEEARIDKEKAVVALDQKKKGHELIINGMEEQIRAKENQFIELRSNIEGDRIKFVEMQERVDDLKKRLEVSNAQQQQLINTHEEQLQREKSTHATLLAQKQSELESNQMNFKTQLDQLNATIQSIEQTRYQDIQSIQLKNTLLEGSIASLKSKLNEEQDKLQAQESQIKKLQHSSTENKTELEKNKTESEKKAGGLNERIASLLLEISTIKEQSLSISHQQKDVESQLEAITQQKQKVETELNKKNEHIAQLQNAEKETTKKLTETQDKLIESETNNANILQQQIESTKVNATLSQKVKEIESQLEKKKERISSLEINSINLTTNKTELEEQIHKQKRNLSDQEILLQQEREKHREDIASLHKENKKALEEQYIKLNAQKEQYDNQIREMLESTSGKEQQEQIDQLKEQYSKQNKELNERQVELINKLEKEKTERESEANDFKIQIQQKSEQIYQLVQKHEEEMTCQKKHQDEELEKKIQGHNEEVVLLEGRLTTKEQQISVLEENINQMQAELQEKENGRKKLGDENQRLSREIESRISENSIQLALVAKSNEDMIQSMKCSLVEEHAEYSNKVQSKHNKEIEQLRQQIEQIEQAKEQSISGLEKEIAQKSKVIDEISISMITYQEESDTYKLEVHQLNQQLQQIKQQLDNTLEQNQLILIQQQQKYQLLENTNADLTQKYNLDTKSLLTDLDARDAQIKTLNETLLFNESKVEEWKKLANQYKEDIETKEKNWEEKYQNYSAKEKDHWEQLEQKNQMINTFYENQNKIIIQNEQIMKQNAGKHELELKAKNEAINSNLKEIKLLHSQIEALNNEKKENSDKVNNLDREIFSLKSQLTEVKNPEDTQQQQKEEWTKQQKTISQLNEELQQIKNQCSQQEQEVKVLKQALLNFKYNGGQTQSQNDIDNGETNGLSNRYSNSIHSSHEIESSNSLNISPTHNIPRLNMSALNKETSEFLSPRQPNSATTTKVMELQIQVRSLESKNTELKDKLKAFKDISKINTEMKKLLDENRKLMKEIESQLSVKKNENEQLEKENKEMKNSLTDFENFEEKMLEMRHIDMNRFEQVKDKIEDLKEVAESRIDMVNIIQMFALNFKKELDDKNEKLRQYLRKLEKMTRDFSKLQEQHEEMAQLLLQNNIDISKIFNKEEESNPTTLSRQNSDLDRRSISSDIQEFNPPIRTRPGTKDQDSIKNHNTSCTGGDCNIF